MAQLKYWSGTAWVPASSAGGTGGEVSEADILAAIRGKVIQPASVELTPGTLITGGPNGPVVSNSGNTARILTEADQPTIYRQPDQPTGMKPGDYWVEGPAVVRSPVLTWQGGKLVLIEPEGV